MIVLMLGKRAKPREVFEASDPDADRSAAVLSQTACSAAISVSVCCAASHRSPATVLILL